MRRGPTLTPILIGGGQYYDVCAMLGVSYEEAEDICRRSPEVQAFKRSRYLDVISFPPAAAAPAPVVVPPTPTPEPAAAVSTPTPVTPTAVVVSGVDVTSEVISTAVTLPEAEPALAAPVADEVPVPAPRVVREPSMDWSEADLREYARTRGIDVSKAKSKTAVLKAIRGK
jgi:hypothetical protein